MAVIFAPMLIIVAGLGLIVIGLFRKIVLKKPGHLKLGGAVLGSGVALMAISVLLIGYGVGRADPAAMAREQDNRNVRNLFRIPGDVKELSYHGDPLTGGIFGREGLKISMVFEFTPDQLARYLEAANRKDLWTPRPFEGRSPTIEKEFSERSLEWNSLPLPSFGPAVSQRFRRIQNGEAISAVRNGRFRCTVSEYDAQGKAPIHATFKRWECGEFDGKHLAFTLGVLDTDARRLYVEYQM